MILGEKLKSGYVFVLGFCVILLSGCMSLQPMDLSPEEVRKQIRAGELANLGDRILVTTEDSKTYIFQVVEVTDCDVRGSEEAVQIDTIVSIHVRQPARERTVVAILGTLGIIYTVAALKAVDDVLDDITN